MVARATVDFPQPDSPTSPSASPRLSVKLRPGTTLSSPARRTYEIRTSWNSSSGAPVAASVTQPDLPEPDGEEVERDDQRGDRCARYERHVGPHRDHAVRVPDHAAPVRVRRRNADAEEAEDPDEDRVVPDAEAHVDDERPTRVGKDLDDHDVQRGLPAHLRRRDVLALPELEREPAHDAVDDRRPRQREHDDDVQRRGAELREDDHVEDDDRERENDVGDAT